MRATDGEYGEDQETGGAVAARSQRARQIGLPIPHPRLGPVQPNALGRPLLRLGPEPSGSRRGRQWNGMFLTTSPVMGTGAGWQGFGSLVFLCVGRPLTVNRDLEKQWPDSNVVAVGELHFSADEQTPVQDRPPGPGLIA